MDESELRERAARWAERTAVEHGLPLKIAKPVVLRKVATRVGFVDEDSGLVEETTREDTRPGEIWTRL